MRVLLTEDFLPIPADVEMKVKSRKVTVKGPRGTVIKDFSHLPCEIEGLKDGGAKRKGPHLRIRMWFGGYKQACAVNTLKSHIQNMITGVTEVRNRVWSPVRSYSHQLGIRARSVNLQSS